MTVDSVVAGAISGAVGFNTLYLGNGSTGILLAKFLGSNDGTLFAMSTGDLQRDCVEAVEVVAGDNVLTGGFFRGFGKSRLWTHAERCSRGNSQATLS